MPPMMHHVATDSIASPSSPSLRPHRHVRYTATATATKVKNPCQESMNPTVRMMSGSKGMLITARISINYCLLPDLLSVQHQATSNPNSVVPLNSVIPVSRHSHFHRHSCESRNPPGRSHVTPTRYACSNAAAPKWQVGRLQRVSGPEQLPDLRFIGFAFGAGSRPPAKSSLQGTPPRLCPARIPPPGYVHFPKTACNTARAPRRITEGDAP